MKALFELDLQVNADPLKSTSNHRISVQLHASTVHFRVRRDIMEYLRGYAILIALATSTLISQVLQLTPMIDSTGDDLHTAVQNHKISRVRKLLDTGLAGEALDVNGPTKALEGLSHNEDLY